MPRPRSRRRCRPRSRAARGRTGRACRADRAAPAMPAAPSATPTVPFRHARPRLSMMRTPASTPVRAASRARISRQERLQSSGSSSTCSSSPVTLEVSMPALASTMPLRCATTSTPLRCRTTSVDSRRISSTSRGSLSTSAASCCARADGVTSRRSTTRPSALDTIFCAMTTTSPRSQREAGRCQAVRRSGRRCCRPRAPAEYRPAPIC